MSPSCTTYSLPSDRIVPFSFAAFRAPASRKSRPADGLGADEAALEVGVDHAGGLRRRVAAMDRPGAHFLLAGGEVA